MNIDLLSKMVLELIIEYDKVVLPFFGVFTAEVVSSSFSDRGYTLNPPYRRLHFKASSQSDNLLAEFYAKANGVDVDTAFRIVSEFTKELRNVLLKSKVLVFPGLGRIRTTRENNFFFVPDEDLDIYPEGFGLKPISLKAHRTDVLNSAAVPSGSSDDEPAEESVDAVETAEQSEIIETESSETPIQQIPEEQHKAQLEVQTDTQSGIEQPANEHSGLKITITVVLGIIAVAGFLLLIFLLLSDLCPSFIDSLLYTEEELEILNYKY